MRRVNRDRNHAGIVNEITQHNISVLDLAAVGGGCPDLLIGFKTVSGNRINILVELKSSSTANIRPIQAEFNREWNGLSTIVWDAESVLHICRHHGLKF